MRQMTYTQAATCGENLKVLVTPEQSEKMQVAWFAAGKKASIHINQERFLFLSDTLYSSGYLATFQAREDEEIELIDDLPQHDFASQQEVLTWLCQGNKVIHDNGIVVGFKNGKLWDFTGNQPFENESDFIGFPNEWGKHTPPRLIRVNGVEVPAPLESLEGIEVVYISVPTHPEKYLAVQSKTYSDSQMQKWKDDSLCYATKEDAIKRAEAMVKFEVVVE